MTSTTRCSTATRASRSSTRPCARCSTASRRWSAKHPEYTDSARSVALCEPERQIIFRVPWVDDDGEVQINRGFRVEFNSALGPYKGGLRFHPSVNLGIVKFLGFEQIFKNALTGLPIGGGKGGSDFDPKGRSDGEIMRFCQSLHDRALPAHRRVHRRTRGRHRRRRPRDRLPVRPVQADHQPLRVRRPHRQGHGLGRLAGAARGHRLRRRLLRRGDPAQPRTSPSTASGSSCPGRATSRSTRSRRCTSSAERSSPARTPAASSPTRRGSTSTCSSRSRRSTAAAIDDYAEKRDSAEFSDKGSVWEVACDVAMPCGHPERDRRGPRAPSWSRTAARSSRRARTCRRRPRPSSCSSRPRCAYAPGKAANAGGVATSALEMQQNASRDTWDFEHTEERLADDHARHPRPLPARPPTSTASRATTPPARTSPASSRSPTRCWRWA